MHERGSKKINQEINQEITPEGAGLRFSLRTGEWVSHRKFKNSESKKRRKTRSKETDEIKSDLGESVEEQVIPIQQADESGNNEEKQSKSLLRLEWEEQQAATELRDAAKKEAKILWGSISLLLLVSIGYALVSEFITREPTLVVAENVTQEPPGEVVNTPPVAQSPLPHQNVTPRRASRRMSAEQVASLFCETTSATERLKYVRNPESTKEHLADYDEQALSASVSRLQELGVKSAQGLECHSFVANFLDGSKRLLTVVKTAQGYKVDWDAYARHGSASWGEIFSGEINSGEMRVFVSKDSHYSSEYTEEEWSCYTLTSPDLDGVVYGYVEKESDVERGLNQLLAERSAQRVFLNVSKIDNNVDDRRVIIGKLIASSWVVSNE